MSVLKALKAVLVGIIVVTVLTTLLWIVLSRRPVFTAVPEDAPRITAGDPRVDGARIGAFRATYRRTTKILGGVPFGSQPATLAVAPAMLGDSSLMSATITLGPANGIADSISLEQSTLRPRARSFTTPGGGAVQISFEGSAVRGSLTQPDGTENELAYDFDSPVFEVSLLELLFAALQLEEGFVARVAWDNMLDPQALWAEVRVAGRETVAVEGGREYETWLVQVAFASGNRRWFWIAQEPPYKIRAINFTRGRAVFSVWDLVEVQTGPTG